MKKLLFALTFISAFSEANAQSYIGYTPDNYAGVQSVLFNPASIADSRFKADINLFSISGMAGNDLYGVKLLDVFKSDYDFNNQSRKSFSLNNHGIINADIMGPSVMFNIAPKHTLAVFTRARSVSNFSKINGYIIDQVNDGLDEASNFSYANNNPNGASNSWGEVGISYAAVLYQRGEHFLKGGITAKYLQGGANGYAQGKNLDFAYVKDAIHPEDARLNKVRTTGELTIGSSQDFEANDEYKFDSKANGVGFDFGLVYEWRPDFKADDVKNAKAGDNYYRDLNKYKIRFGVSVTDIGAINYKNRKLDTYDMTGVVSQEKFDDMGDFYEFMNANYTKIASSRGVKTNLPTAFHADVDYNAYKKFYINLNGDLNLVNRDKINAISIGNRVSLTPRYESRWFSFYVPVTWMEYSGTEVGAGLRAGVFFLGSGSVVSNLVSKNSQAADIHLGVKIPIYQKKLKDKDDDGILDKDDACPTVAGPVENKGCPWPDTDGDGVLDKDDACPNQAGPAENKGCPWPDTDGDGVLDKDDACPTVPGPKENNGCPILDADKDGVPDNIDDCPTVPGPASNRGCPEVTKEVLQELKVQARAIYFNTGKATFKTGDLATPARLDAIREIIRNYPNAKFSIDGYTDSTGSAKINQKLSEDRANAVKKALIERGVSADNLEAHGHGAADPVATNKTAAGRAENRRTEIKHIGSNFEGKF